MSKEDDVFNSVFTYIEDNLTEKLTVEEIAKHVYLRNILEYLWRNMSGVRS